MLVSLLRKEGIARTEINTYLISSLVSHSEAYRRWLYASLGNIMCAPSVSRQWVGTLSQAPIGYLANTLPTVCVLC